MSVPDTRHSLLLRLRDHRNQEAWADFVGIYQPLIERMVRAQGLQESDAADVTQEVLLAIAKAADRWQTEPIERFRAWLRTATRNVVVNFLIRRARHPQATGDSGFAQWLEEIPMDGPESGLYSSEERQHIFAWAVEQARSEFQTATWQAFWKTSVVGLEVPAVAAELGLSAGAIYVARSRVMNRLREKVAERLTVEET